MDNSSTDNLNKNLFEQVNKDSLDERVKPVSGVAKLLLSAAVLAVLLIYIYLVFYFN